MELISLSENAAAKSVTASIPFVASDTASFREGYGCVLQEWEGYAVTRSVASIQPPTTTRSPA